MLQAELSGYRSTTIEISDKSLLREPRLPVLVLAANRPGMNLEVNDPGSFRAPSAVRGTSAQKAMLAQNWAEAERQLRAVTATDAKFRLGWAALGMVYHNQKKPTKPAKRTGAPWRSTPSRFRRSLGW